MPDRPTALVERSQSVDSPIGSGVDRLIGNPVPVGTRENRHECAPVRRRTSCAIAADCPVRSPIETSRALQQRRYARLSGVRCNAHASGRWLLAHGVIEPLARELVAVAWKRSSCPRAAITDGCDVRHTDGGADRALRSYEHSALLRARDASF